MKQVVNNRTKIIATIGPSSSDYQTLTEMVIKGVDVVRLNFSHGSHKDHKKVISNVRKISDELGVPITILQDLQGPKIRVGKLEKEQIVLKDGNNLSVTSKNIIGNQDSICIDNNVIGDIKIGEKILIDDGKIELKVVSKEDKQLEATVVRGGILLERKGVNLPESDIKLSSVTEKDIKDLNFGLKNDVDWIALSFVRSAKDS